MTKKPVYRVQVTTLPKNGFTIEIEASDDECRFLADAVGAEQVSPFRADMTFRTWRKGGVKVEGRIRAALRQACVVTLEPIETAIDETFEQTFLPEGSKLSKPRLNDEGEMVLDPEGADIPDLFSGDSLDAWDILTEHFILAVDPFPRKPEAELNRGLAEEVAGSDKRSAEESPFAVLAQLRTRK